MDDLHIRRSILADPKSDDEAIIAAITKDPATQHFAKKVHAVDEKITQAMNVPMPENLYNKIILKQTLASHQQQKRKTRVHLAMAASVLFTLGLSINFMMFSNTYKNLGDYALAHVNYEAEHFTNNSQVNISLASLNTKMAAFNASVNRSLGKLMFADYCRFDGSKSLHLVFQGNTSPVNVFVMPRNDEIAFNKRFASKSLQGRAINFDNVNVIIVGDNKESLSQWQEQINNNITWSI